MKIVAIDNYDRDYIPEREVETGLDRHTANSRCFALNASAKRDPDLWYVVRPDDVKTRTHEDIYK